MWGKRHPPRRIKGAVIKCFLHFVTASFAFKNYENNGSLSNVVAAHIRVASIFIIEPIYGSA